MSGAANCSKVSDRMIDLRPAAELVEERLRPRQGAEPVDHLGHQRHRQVVLVEEAEPVPHEDVVVRLLARRAAQGVDPGALGDRDPDLGDEHALEVEGHDRLSLGHHDTLGVPRDEAAIAELAPACG